MPTESAPRRFIHLFGGPRESSDLVGIARGACREGYAVIPIDPGGEGKSPLCTLTARQSMAADKMAANAAREAGKLRWEAARHPCGLSHAITDPNEAERVFKRLVDRHPDLNLALECSQSRLICVDCDNIDELRSFTELWAREEGIPELADAAPTVRTPGKVDERGQWVHKDGGHFWFLLPDGVDFIDTGISTSLPIGVHAEAKAQVRYGRSYALVPPSVRDEGPYVMASDIGPCPEWLVDILREHVEGVAVRRVSHLASKDGSDPIDIWSSLTSWEELLGSDGWLSRGRPDNCGCPVWTRPGEWTNPKSATAHEPGCVRWETDSLGHGFLHVWTDNPPEHIVAYRHATGHSSMSKLQYVAWRDFSGDSSETMAALGITSGSSEPVMSDDEIFAAARESMSGAGKQREPQGREFHDETAETPADLGADERESGSADDETEELSPFEKLRAEFISAADLDKIPKPCPLVDGLLDLNTTTRVIGSSGHGKTFVMIDLSAHIITGRSWQGRPCTPGRVAYIVAEGAAGFTTRVRAWESHHDAPLGDGLMVLPRPVQAGNAMEWATLVEVLRYMEPVMVVIDTQARVTVGMEENSAKDMGIFVDRADRIKIATGACVVLVHHQGHTGSQGRGSSAVLGALDAEIAVTKEAKGRIAVLSSKQKDREDFDPIQLDLVSFEGSAVLVARGEGEPLLANVIDSNSPARDRIAKIMWTHFNGPNGATKAEIKGLAMRGDKGSIGKPIVYGTFMRHWTHLDEAGALVFFDAPQGGVKVRLAKSEAVRLGLVDLREALDDGGYS